MNRFNFNEEKLFSKKKIMRGSTSKAARAAFHDMLEDTDFITTTYITDTYSVVRGPHLLNEIEVFG